MLIKKRFFTVFISLLIFILSVTPGYANDSSGWYKQNKDFVDQNTSFPAVLKYFLKDTGFPKNWNTPEIIALAKEITKDAYTDYAKSKAIHAWVVTNLYYDYDHYTFGKPLLANNNDLIDILKKKAVVCDGFSSMTAGLHRAVGIPAKIIAGYGNIDRHSWNEVYVNNRWILIDTTWDCENAYRNGEYVLGDFVKAGILIDGHFDESLESFSMDHKYSGPTSVFFDLNYLESNVNVVIPDGFTDMPWVSFENNRDIVSVKIPNTMIEIYGFENAINLKTVTMSAGGGTERIGANAFKMCTSMKEVTIPFGVKEILWEAFAGCDSLTKVEIPGSVVRIEDDAFGVVEFFVYDARNNKGILQKHYPKNLKIVGELGSYAEKYAKSHNIKFQAKSVPQANVKVLVDGELTNFEAYTINGNNFFKLRDLAKVMDGTLKQFEVTWDGNRKAISLISNKSYSVVGGELAAGNGLVKFPSLSNALIYKDGVKLEMLAYIINGNIYFKLQELAKAFDIGIGWDNSSRTIVVDSDSSYVE